MATIEEHIKKLVESRDELERLTSDAQVKIDELNKLIRSVCKHTKTNYVKWVGDVCITCRKVT